MSIAEKLTTIAENQQRVFDAGRNSGGGDGDYDSGYTDGYSNGYDSGYSDGHSMGFSEGQTAEYDRFWDAYQQNGNRYNYEHAFGGLGWTNETFRPKYDIKPTHAYMLFRGSGIEGDLVEILDNLGVTLDFSNCNNTQYMMTNAKITRMGVVDLTNNPSGADGMFQGCPSLKTIDLLRVTEAQNDLDGMFSGCSSLENITFEGTIGNNCTFNSCTKLSKASIWSIIDHLSATATGKTLTLSRTAVDNAFGDGSEFSGTDGPEWGELIETRANWTIALV